MLHHLSPACWANPCCVTLCLCLFLCHGLNHCIVELLSCWKVNFHPTVTDCKFRQVFPQYYSIFIAIHLPISFPTPTAPHSMMFPRLCVMITSRVTYRPSFWPKHIILILFDQINFIHKWCCFHYMACKETSAGFFLFLTTVFPFLFYKGYI